MLFKKQQFFICVFMLTQCFAPSHSELKLDPSRKLSRHYHRNPDPQQSVRLLVLVLAGGNKPAYFVERGFWRLLAERVRPLGVQVYLISTLPGIKEPLIDAETIHFPDNSTAESTDIYDYRRYVSMSVDRYVEMMRFVYEKRLHGSDAPYVLRSTLASFWCFSRLLRWLDGMPRTNFGASSMPGNGLNDASMHNGIESWSGAGFLLSSDVAQNVLIRSDELNRNLCDDLALAQLIHKMGVQTTYWFRMDAYSKPVNALPAMFANETKFHQWRVVSEPQSGQSSVQDAAVWASLFFYHYGPTMEMRHDAFHDHSGICVR